MHFDSLSILEDLHFLNRFTEINRGKRGGSAKHNHWIYWRLYDKKRVIDLRKWDYIEDQKEWELFKKSLTDKEISLYHTFMSYRSHLVKTEKKIDKLNKDLEIQKENKRDYLKKLTELNSKIDYLKFHIKE